ncbi:unnamed protein product [Moneuplotes crassus]|uniref:Uncharacterized protein n=1 Tax=Euplotes crassus TaxID=5936 RepID=A0AAD1XF76_EUPCR|nr:unnamed protein product [Moneuplotes crassus]
MGCTGSNSNPNQRTVKRTRTWNERYNQQINDEMEEPERLLNPENYENLNIKIGDDVHSKELELDFSHRETLELLETLQKKTKNSKKRLPDLDVLKITSMRKPKDHRVNMFLKDHFPCKVGSFYFDESPLFLNKDFADYQGWTLECLGRVTGSVMLCGFRITANQFQIIIQRSKEIPSVTFSECKLATENLSFDPINSDESVDNTDIKFNCKQLGFIQCESYYNDLKWKESGTEIKSILTAIKTCTLKNSLTEITIKDCGVSKQTIVRLMPEDLHRIKLKVSEGVIEEEDKQLSKQSEDKRKINGRIKGTEGKSESKHSDEDIEGDDQEYESSEDDEEREEEESEESSVEISIESQNFLYEGGEEKRGFEKKMGVAGC